MKLYKVVTMKDRWFAGGFTPQALEAATNTLAAEGWRLVSVTAADFGGEWGIADTFGKTRVQMALFFEKDVPEDYYANLPKVEVATSIKDGKLVPGGACPSCGKKNDYNFALARCSKCEATFLGSP
jgi:hypothetical protein